MLESGIESILFGDATCVIFLMDVELTLTWKLVTSTSTWTWLDLVVCNSDLTCKLWTRTCDFFHTRMDFPHFQRSIISAGFSWDILVKKLFALSCLTELSSELDALMVSTSSLQLISRDWERGVIISVWDRSYPISWYHTLGATVVPRHLKRRGIHHKDRLDRRN